ncbi:NUDIX hydrolase domain-like protein [Phlebopus sp. FC_14]|nr:NUDIX hydrolase domain-like protein [Phlebopus sp. FC_14]
MIAASCGEPRRSVLSLVLSSINLALPIGPFDDPSAIHRASCYAGSIPTKEEERLVPLLLHSSLSSGPLGFLRPEVVQAILNHKESEKTWDILRRTNGSPWAIAFTDGIGDIDARSQALGSVLKSWRDQGLFPDILKGWSNETYPVYMPRQLRTSAVDSHSVLAFGIERAALPLFGFVNFGCLLTAFYECSETGKTMVWIPRRSLSKSTWPGRYDCTVGGGMALGESPINTIIRECTEEASLPRAFVKEHVRSTGVLTFMNRSPAKWLLPGMYYLYELRLPADGSIQPYTNIEDGEVDSFRLMSTDEALELLMEGLFKPSSAMALIDFCIRRGIITPESDPRYLDVCMAMRRPVVLPLP